MANAGRRGGPIAPLVLSAQERNVLGETSPSSPCCASLSERWRAILRYADGLPSKSVAAKLGLHEHTVGKWHRRFLKDRCDGLLDEARPGRPRTINDDQVAAVIERTLRTTPADATHPHNENPRPFKWTTSADQILASVKRFCHKAQQTLRGEL